MKKLALALVLGAICSTAALAAPSGFNNSYGPQGFDTTPKTLKSIDEIKQMAREDDFVILEGKLTNFFGDEKYEFTDNKGQTIVVELDDDHGNYSHISKDMPITIYGKVDRDHGYVTVDVYNATPLNQ